MTTTGATNQSKTGTTRAHGPLPTLRGASLGLAVLAALIALAFLVLGGATASAQTPEPVTFVKNDGQTAIAPVDFSRDLAMGFQTGSTDAGYVLSSVELDMLIGNPAGNPPTYTVKLYDSVNDSPGSELMSLTNPASLATGLNSFTARSGYHLDADTWYWVVLSVSVGGSNFNPRLQYTDRGGESGETGWLISNSSYHKSRTESSWTVELGETPRFQVKGHNDTTPPLVTSAEVRFSTLRINFNEALDPDSVPPVGSFSVDAGGETVEVSGVGVSGSTVTLTLTDPVEHGATARVSYTPPGSSPLRDLSGNEVAQFENQAVTNIAPDFEVGVIYEVVGGGHRVVRDEDGHCYVESYMQSSEDAPYLWFRSVTYGQDEEGCRRAAWDAYRSSMGEERILGSNIAFPDGRPPALEIPSCPSGWEASTSDGQQWCSIPVTDATTLALSPERAREFVRLGLRTSDFESTDDLRQRNYYTFAFGGDCGEDAEYRFIEGGELACVSTKYGPLPPGQGTADTDRRPPATGTAIHLEIEFVLQERYFDTEHEMWIPAHYVAKRDADGNIVTRDRDPNRPCTSKTWIEHLMRWACSANDPDATATPPHPARPLREAVLVQDDEGRWVFERDENGYIVTRARATDSNCAAAFQHPFTGHWVCTADEPEPRPDPTPEPTPAPVQPPRQESQTTINHDQPPLSEEESPVITIIPGGDPWPPCTPEERERREQGEKFLECV